MVPEQGANTQSLLPTRLSHWPTYYNNTHNLRRPQNDSHLLDLDKGAAQLCDKLLARDLLIHAKAGLQLCMPPLHQKFADL